MSDKQPKKMTDEEFHSDLLGMAEDAEQFVDGTLSRDRAAATNYYLGGPLGNEEEGRSQFVMTTVRDSVHALLPSALRVIFGAERAVEFVPKKAADVEGAEQATDYAQYVFAEDNPGFAITHGVWKDALVRKLGVYKWSWDDTSSVRNYAIKDVKQSELELILQDDGVELTRATTKHPGSAAVTAPAPVVPGQPAQADVVLQPAIEPTYDVELRYSEVDGRVRIDGLPPEEFLFSRDGRSIATATLVGHRTQKRASELLAMGVSQNDIDEHGGTDETLATGLEAVARDIVMGGNTTPRVEQGEANELHDYAELFPFIDYDGDGIAELRRVCTIGPTHHVISNEPATSRPFALFCPDPEPHTMLGQSWADRLMDLQKMESSIIRATADSLALSIFPRMGYVEGEVNYQDLSNTEIGASIRMKQVGVLQPILHPFVGKEAFPLVEYLKQVKEQRTGQADGGMGLDADALQSTEKAAAGAVVSQAQGQTELLVRIFAETTLKPLFRGILGLLCEHRPKKKMIRLRGKWVDIDPRAWDANMDVTCNVALGTSLVEQKLNALAGIAAKQELVITTFGPGNPGCTLGQYIKTLRKMTELSGFKDTDTYFGEVPENWQPPAPASPSDPMIEVKKQELMLRDKHEQQKSATDAQKMQSDQAVEAAKLDLERQKLAQSRELAQEDIRLKLELGTAELDLKYKTNLAVETMRIQVEGAREVAKNAREDANNHLQHERTMVEARQTQAHERATLEMQHAHEIEIAKLKPAPSKK